MKIFAVFVFSFLLSGCVASTTVVQVPSGIYREPSHAESIEARGNGLTFSIRVPKLDPQKVLTRGPYEYAVNSSGHIRIYASSNDSVFVFGIMNYDWSWDGKNIVRKDVRTGEVVTFAPEAKAQK
jgi:hypothetical protein